MGFERVDYGCGGRVCSNGDAMHAQFAESACRYGANCGDRNFILKRGEADAACQVGEIVYGAGAEKQDDVVFDDGVDARLIGGGGGNGAVSGDFGDAGTQFTECGGEIGVGFIASWEEDGFAGQV